MAKKSVKKTAKKAVKKSARKTSKKKVARDSRIVSSSKKSGVVLEDTNV